MPTTYPTPPYLTPAEVARATGGVLAASTVRKWAVNGQIPGAVRTIGGHVLIPVQAVDQLLRPIEPATAEQDKALTAA